MATLLQALRIKYHKQSNNNNNVERKINLVNLCKLIRFAGILNNKFTLSKI